MEKAELQISKHLSGLGQRALQLPEQGTGILEDTEREPKLWKDLFFFFLSISKNCNAPRISILILKCFRSKYCNVTDSV